MDVIDTPPFSEDEAESEEEEEETKSEESDQTGKTPTDEEGDLCSLTPATFPDFMLLAGEASGRKLLKLEIRRRQDDETAQRRSL